MMSELQTSAHAVPPEEALASLPIYALCCDHPTSILDTASPLGSISYRHSALPATVEWHAIKELSTPHQTSPKKLTAFID